MSAWRPPSSNRSQTPLRLHTPQAIRPSSRVLLDDQHAWVPATASPPPSVHPDLFSDTESLFSTTSTKSARKKRRKSSQPSSPAAQVLRFVSKQSPQLVTPGIILVVILIKSVISLGSFSGQRKPPLFGDLEAQRHWLSLTIHKPVSQWYFYNLEYWGLDYPPLTAYHSLLMAKLFHMLGGDGVIALRDTQEVSEESVVKTWMRLSVIWTEVFVWLPIVFLWSRTRAPKAQSLAALLMLLQPALVLIDNGHFQYNSVMLGFTLLAQVCFHWEFDLLGATSFVLSLCYKQMALYYAPAVFAYLLGKCLVRRDANLFFSIAFVTVVSFALCFSPFLSSAEQITQVVHRMFPFARGLFEDKVANFWCALNVVYKLRRVFDTSTLTKLALGATVAAILPGMLLFITRPRKELLPFALANSSLAFFLFSFQVHEKSVLLPLMPLTAIMSASELGSEDHSWTSFFSNVAVFSMWPLLKKDGLTLQYCILPFFTNYLMGVNPLKYRGFIKYLCIGTFASILLLHVTEALIAPPERYPDLYPVLNVGISAPIFGLTFLWTLKRLAQEAWAMSAVPSVKGQQTTAGHRDQSLMPGEQYRRPSGVGETLALPAEVDRRQQRGVSLTTDGSTHYDGLRRRN